MIKIDCHQNGLDKCNTNQKNNMKKRKQSITISCTDDKQMILKKSIKIET